MNKESPPGDGSPMSAEDAMRTMANVTALTGGLRVRTEGLTIIIFAICMMASYLTLLVPILFAGSGGGGGDFAQRFNESANRSFNGSFNGTFNGTRAPSGWGGGRPPPTAFFLSHYAPLLWYAIAVLVTTGIWRSAALSFQHGLSTPRLVATFIGWLAIFASFVFVLTYLQGGAPRSWHLIAWALVIGLFAMVDPLRFSKQGRMGAGVMAGCLLLTAVYAHTAGLGGRDIGFLSGVALGIPGLAVGLWLLFRG